MYIQQQREFKQHDLFASVEQVTNLQFIHF